MRSIHEGAPMSGIPSASGSPATELQFEHAEYAAPTPAAACSICKQPMEVYYEVNRQPFCEHCHEQLQQTLNAGSKSGRFVRATLYGSAAGLLGAAVYYGVREATNFEFGIIAILVGLIIGKAVKKGSNARGGWFYQGLAIFLTYTAIVLTYIPPLMKAVADHREKKPVAANIQNAAKKGDQTGAAAPQLVPKPAEKVAQPAKVAEDAKAKPVPHVRPSGLKLLLALVLIVGLAYALPIMVGFQSPMSLIIIGIGLYEAWVINRRLPIKISGPFQIGQAGAGNAVHVQPNS
jgi:hypothetical protein